MWGTNCCGVPVGVRNIRFSMVAFNKAPMWPGLQNTAVGLPAGALQVPLFGSCRSWWGKRPRPFGGGCGGSAQPGLSVSAWVGWPLECWLDLRLNRCPPGLCCTLAMTWGKRLSEGLIGFESPVKCMCSAQVKAVILKFRVVGVAVQDFALLLLH